jgi:uncharacterized protein YdhG (YjbR/CyaY superfamily)
MKRQGIAGSRLVDEYLGRVAAEMRAPLQELRRTIRLAAPDAEEVISYGLPTFRLPRGRVYYGAFKDHCSLFPGSIRILRKFADELEPFAAGRGTLRFTPEHPIPASLVKRIVKARIAESESTDAVTKRKPGKRSPTQRRRTA